MPRQDVGKSQPSAHMRYLLYSCAAIIVGKLEHLNVSCGRSPSKTTQYTSLVSQMSRHR